MLKNVPFLTACLVCSAITFKLASAQVLEAEISRADLKCLEENLDNYVKDQGEPFIVVLSACPTTDPIEALARSATAGILDHGNASRSIDVLTLTRREAICIISLLNGGDDDPTKITLPPRCSQ